MKAVKIAFVFICIAALVLPLALMPVWGSSTAEKRALAPRPALFDGGGLNMGFFADVEAYFSDRFAARSLMVSAYSAVLEHVFSQSSSDKVIVGSDGWLYFAETLGDYSGESALTDAELSRLILTLELVEEAVNERGQKLFFMLVPNKNTVHPEHMPKRCTRRDDPSTLDEIARRADVALIDLSCLYDGMSFFHTDTHWNEHGARLAAIELIRNVDSALDVESPALPTKSEKERVACDLSLMLYPALTPTEETERYPALEDGYSHVGRYRSPDDMLIETEGGAAGVSLMMFRDSFAERLMPYLSYSYEHAVYSRVTPYDLEQDSSRDADVIVIECVERNVDDIIAAPPLIMAPKRDEFDISGDIGALERVDVETTEHGALISGFAPDLVDDLHSLRATVVMRDGSTRTFAAFPIATAGDGSEFADGAFSLLTDIPAEDISRVYLLQEGAMNALYAGDARQ